MLTCQNKIKLQLRVQVKVFIKKVIQNSLELNILFYIQIYTYNSSYEQKLIGNKIKIKFKNLSDLQHKPSRRNFSYKFNKLFVLFAKLLKYFNRLLIN